MAFWIISIGLVVVVAVAAIAVIFRAPEAEAEGLEDLAVYRDQLDGIDRDLARGVLAADEAEAIRTEVSRRLLAADKAATEGAKASTSRGARLLGTAIVAVPLFAGSLAIYWLIGSPGLPDLPLADRIAAAEERYSSRMSQAEAEALAASRLPPPRMPAADISDLLDRLRAAVADRPDDLQGQVLLARNEAALGNYVSAAKAYGAIVRIKGDTATPADLAAHADALVLAAGGFVSPEAELAVSRLLEADPRSGAGRYYLGLMFTQNARPDRAFAVWRTLLEESAPNAPWVPVIEAQITDLALSAGVRYAPPVRRGPSAADIAAAEDMSVEERAAFIESMVEGLAAQLAEEGGPPEDWAQLIRALGVLGQTDRAAAIWSEAQVAFGDTPGLPIVLEAARQAGVAE